MATILVIDDDELTRALYRTVLAQKNHTVLEAESGQQGLQRLGEEPVDLVLTDIFMEDKDGLEVIEELRGMGNNVPVVAITGVPSLPTGGPDYLALARSCGADEVMSKPLDWKQMLAIIENLLGNSSGNE